MQPQKRFVDFEILLEYGQATVLKRKFLNEEYKKS